MAKRYSKEWKKNVLNGVRKYREKNPLTDATRKKLSDAGKLGNSVRVYKKKPIEELKSIKLVRQRLFESRGRKCEKCNWAEVRKHDKIIPVEVHHKNGDNEDNREENLIILCPNCHSLERKGNSFGLNNTKIKESTKKRYKYIAGLVKRKKY